MYFAHSPVDGMEFHATEKAAREAAEEMLKELAESGFMGGDDPEHVCWGKILQRGKQQDNEKDYSLVSYRS